MRKTLIERHRQREANRAKLHAKKKAKAKPVKQRVFEPTGFAGWDPAAARKRREAELVDRINTQSLLAASLRRLVGDSKVVVIDVADREVEESAIRFQVGE